MLRRYCVLSVFLCFACMLSISLSTLACSRYPRENIIVAATKVSQKMTYAAYISSQMYSPPSAYSDREMKANPLVGEALYHRYQKLCRLGDSRLANGADSNAAVRWLIYGDGSSFKGCGDLLTVTEIEDILAYLGHQVDRHMLETSFLRREHTSTERSAVEELASEDLQGSTP